MEGDPLAVRTLIHSLLVTHSGHLLMLYSMTPAQGGWTGWGKIELGLSSLSFKCLCFFRFKRADFTAGKKLTKWEGRKVSVKLQLLNCQGNFYLLSRDGEVLFIKTDFTADFERRHLGNVKTRNSPAAHKTWKIKLWRMIYCFRFILITHNSDYPVPRHKSDLNLLKHPLLIRWFAQNIAPEYRDHGKMEAIPIGLPNQRVGQYQLSAIEPHLE